MEALLLTLDAIFMVLLCLAVVRVYKSGDELHLGIFGYRRILPIKRRTGSPDA